MRVRSLWASLALVTTMAGAAEPPHPASLQLDDLGLERLVPGAFTPINGWLRIDAHIVPDHSIAYYLPQQRLELPLEPQATTEGADEPAVEPTPVATVELPPRVLVFERIYAPNGKLRTIDELPIDAAEYLLHALIEALLDRLQQQDLPPAWLVAAEQTFADIPQEYRREAAIEAYADFGAHLISLANEIERRAADQERRAALCGVATRGVGLFALWSGSFQRQPFPASYYRSASSEPGALPAERIYSAVSLPRVLRERFVAEVLGRPWRGDAMADFFAGACP